jgi:putative membrane protein
MYSWQQVAGTAVLLALAICYRRGWRYLLRHHLTPQVQDDIPSWRLYLPCFSFYAGLLLLWLALFSPLERWTTHYFFARVAQHLLLIAWIPATLLWGRPFTILPLGLSQPLREKIGRWLEKSPSDHAYLITLTHPSVVLFAFVATFWLWYDPALHSATLDHAWLRLVEKSSLLLTAAFYWWHITGSAGALHAPMPPIIRILFTLLGAGPIKLVGLILLFTDETIYNYPGTIALSGLDLTAQSLGGMIIWIAGGLVYSTTAAGLMRSWLGQEDEKPVLPLSVWATEEAMLAPGVRKEERSAPDSLTSYHFQKGDSC